MLYFFFTAGKHGKIERIGEFCFPFTDKHDQSDNMSRLLWVVRYLSFTYAYYMLYLCFAYALLRPLYFDIGTTCKDDRRRLSSFAAYTCCVS